MGWMKHGKRSARQSIYVVKGVKTNFLGLQAITALQLACRIDVVGTEEPDVVKRFPQVFQGLGTIGEEYQIKLKDNATPYSLYLPRNVPIPIRPKVESNGTIGRHFQSHHTSAMVRRDGCHPQEVGRGEDLRRSQTAKRKCPEGALPDAESGRYISITIRCHTNSTQTVGSGRFPCRKRAVHSPRSSLPLGGFTVTNSPLVSLALRNSSREG